MLFLLQQTVKSIQRHLHEFLDDLAQGQPFEPVTSGAVIHARAKLKESAFSELNRDCVLPALYHSEHPVRRWRGHRLVGFDSSLVRLPESEELGQAFGWQAVSNQNGTTGTRYPEARLSVVYDLLNRVGWDTRLEPSTVGEVALASQQLESLQPGDMEINDRGFTGYLYLARVGQRQAHFVARCSTGSFLAAQELFRLNRANQSKVVWLFAPADQKAECQRLGLPLQMRVRLVSLRLPTGELEVLATSLLEKERYPTEEFLTVYHYYDLGRYETDKAFFWGPGGQLDFYLLAGKTMPELIARYTDITGKPRLMPQFGYALTYVSQITQNEHEILNDSRLFRDRGIPCDIIGVEPQWMKKNYDSSHEKEWNPDEFYVLAWMGSDSKGGTFIGGLERTGFKLSLWLVCNDDLTLEEERQVAIREGRGKDFPQTPDAWFNHLQKFVRNGARCFKMDPENLIQEHVGRRYCNGRIDLENHNLTQILYHKQMCQGFEDFTKQRAMNHYCAAYAGAQHWGATTMGDNSGGQKALVWMLNYAMSGHMNTSCDMDTAFAKVGKTLTAQQREKLTRMRTSNPSDPKGPFLYSSPIKMPEIGNTDFLFGAAVE